jgi:hypothetical protein
MPIHHFYLILHAYKADISLMPEPSFRTGDTYDALFHRCPATSEHQNLRPLGTLYWRTSVVFFLSLLQVLDWVSPFSNTLGCSRVSDPIDK